MQNFVGQQIDRYRITERLGTGGMAVVYQAYDTRLEREVALKLIRTSEIPESQHGRLLKRFEREAKTQANISHPNIVPAYDYGEFNGIPYLVLAYVPGGTLKDRMHGPKQLGESLDIIIPIADGIAHAHRMGILHRDIKPSNILFSKDNVPMLTDFGIAKVLETTEATLTGTGLGVGTPEYMAPEQWQGRACAASDQYALGVVFFEMLTGQKPFTAETPLAVAIKQLNDPLPRPSDLAPDIPEEVEKLLYKTLARQPEDRFEDMGAFHGRLVELSDQVAETKEEPPEKVTVPPDKRLSTPVSQSMSESETLDDFNEIEVNSPQQLSQKREQSSQIAPRRKLPDWTYWVGGIILAAGLLIGGIVVLSSQEEVSVSAIHETETPVIVLEAETPSETISLTHTQTPEKSPIITTEPSLTPSLAQTSKVTLEPTLGIGSTMINPVDGAEMVYVPAGEFLMGSEDEYAASDEMPEHVVFLDAFWAYRFEVTNLQYCKCIDAGGCNPALSGQYPSDDYPARNIDWNEAKTYCEWAGGRLPTEAEWEKTARGIDERTYPWGEQEPNCKLANYFNCSNNTNSVFSHFDGESPFNVINLAGNVWEWVSDWYAEDYYLVSDAINPKGPDSGQFRVIRGGSYMNYARDLRVSSRQRADPTFGGDFLGFRCVVDD